MHLNLSLMRTKEKYSQLFFPIVRRYISSNQQTATVRSFLVRFIEHRRKRSQQDDIRLEPYISKGVYTQSGAIRPVSLFKVLFFCYPFFFFAL